MSDRESVNLGAAGRRICQSCGYDLRAAPPRAPRCPECAAVYAGPLYFCARDLRWLAPVCLLPSAAIIAMLTARAHWVFLASAFVIAIAATFRALRRFDFALRFYLTLLTTLLVIAYSLFLSLGLMLLAERFVPLFD